MSEGQLPTEMRLTEAEKAFDAKVDRVFERLCTSGWIYGGGCSIAELKIGIGASFDPDIKRLQTEEALTRLPVKDEEDQLLPGFEVGDDPDTGTVFVGYEGPFDEAFERVVDAMVEIGISAMVSAAPDQLESVIERLAVSPDAGYFDKAVALHREQGTGDVGEGEIILTACKLVREAIEEQRIAAHKTEGDSQEN